MSGEGKGAKAVFDIGLEPTTGPSLDSLLFAKMKNFDIDLPGPDFLAQMCVDKDKIQKDISASVNAMVAKVNTGIRASIAAEVSSKVNLPVKTVQGFLDSRASITVEKVRYPVVATLIDAGPFKLQKRSIVIDPSFGFPRSLV